MKKLKKFVALCASMAVMLSCAMQAAASTPQLKAHVIGIGQGDAIFMELPDQKTMLIDAGNPGDGATILRYAQNLGYKSIDYVVASHAHADHIGGMADVINGIDVKNVYMPNATTNTKTFIDMLGAIQKKGLRITEVKAGVTIPSTNSSLKMEFVAPSKSYEELNNNSAVLKITYGNKALLFTGDAETIEEADITADIKADVLKIGHHGSDTSTSPTFLRRVAPTYAVISVGQGNDYGHPDQSTLDALKNAGAQIYRTDTDGTVIITTDGDTIQISTTIAPIKPNAPPEAETNPVPNKEPEQELTVYWTPNGKSYHHTADCATLKRSKTINSGTLGQAVRAGKGDPCNICAGG